MAFIKKYMTPILITLSLVLFIAAVFGLGWKAGYDGADSYTLADMMKIDSSLQTSTMKTTIAFSLIGIIIMGGALVVSILGLFINGGLFGKLVKFIVFGAIVAALVMILIGVSTFTGDTNKSVEVLGKTYHALDQGALAGLYIMLLVTSVPACATSFMDMRSK